MSAGRWTGSQGPGRQTHATQERHQSASRSIITEQASAPAGKWTASLMSAGSALSHGGTSANLLDDNAAATAAAGSGATKIQRTIRSTTSLPHLSAAAAASSHLQAVSQPSRAGPGLAIGAAACPRPVSRVQSLSNARWGGKASTRHAAWRKEWRWWWWWWWRWCGEVAT